MTANPDDAGALTLITDRAGHLIQIDERTAAFLNISARRHNGPNVLLFIVEGRATVLADLRAVGFVAFPARDALMRPRERRAKPVAITLQEGEGGLIHWLIREREPVQPARPSRRRPPRVANLTIGRVE